MRKSESFTTGRGGRYAIPSDVQMEVWRDFESQPRGRKRARVVELAKLHGVHVQTIWNIVRRFRSASEQKANEPPAKPRGSMTQPTEAGGSLNEGDRTPPATPSATAHTGEREE